MARLGGSVDMCGKVWEGVAGVGTCVEGVGTTYLVIWPPNATHS